MRPLTLNHDAWVGLIDGSPSLQIVTDLAPEKALAPPKGCPLTLALEGRSFLLVVRPPAPATPWSTRIDLPADRAAFVEQALSLVPAIRLTQFGSDGSWTVKFARGGAPLCAPAPCAPVPALLSVRFSLVLARFASAVVRIEQAGR